MGEFGPTDSELLAKMKDELLGQECLKQVLSPAYLLWLKVFYDKSDDLQNSLRFVYNDEEGDKNKAVKEYIVKEIEDHLKLRVEDYIKTRFHEDPATMAAMEELYENNVSRELLASAAYYYFNDPKSDPEEFEALLMVELHKFREKVREAEPTAAELIFEETIKNFAPDYKFSMAGQEIALLNNCIKIIGKKRARELFNEIIKPYSSNDPYFNMLKRLERVINV